MNQYHYIEHQGDHYYSSAIADIGFVELSFYKNRKLIIRKQYKKGFQVISKDDVTLDLEINFRKPNILLKVREEPVSFPIIRKEKLKEILQNLDINNDINPFIPAAKPIGLRSLKTPMIFYAIGIFLYVIVNGKPNYYGIPSLIFMSIGSWGVLRLIQKRLFPAFINNENSTKLLLILSLFLSMILQDTINHIIN